MRLSPKLTHVNAIVSSMFFPKSRTSFQVLLPLLGLTALLSSCSGDLGDDRLYTASAPGSLRAIEAVSDLEAW